MNRPKTGVFARKKSVMIKNRLDNAMIFQRQKPSPMAVSPLFFTFFDAVAVIAPQGVHCGKN